MRTVRTVASGLLTLATLAFFLGTIAILSALACGA
jgi:hypothetical protein